MRFLFTLLVWCVVVPVFGQSELLQSGPMPGYSEMKECVVWLQTRQPSQVQMFYWPKGIPDEVYKTTVVNTTQKEANIAKLIADKVEPGNTYGYEIQINQESIKTEWELEFKSQALWQYRTDPPTFQFAVGSCSYVNQKDYDRPGKPYGGDYQIFERLADKKPDMMLWLGDNIYLREPDWSTRRGILDRYTHTRSLPEMQRLLTSCHHYAIWDDHDFGPNDADGSFFHKDYALEAFQLFWANNGFGINGKPGITNQFLWADCDYFLLDNRYHRTPQYADETKREILGKEQIDWLVDAMMASHSPFKFVAVGGQVLNPTAVYENHAMFPQEREYLIQRIKEEDIKGVIFLSGDRHHTELSKLDLENGNFIYDLTISPLTSGTSSGGKDEGNTLRVDGTYANVRNFGLLEVSGKYGERTLKIECFDKNGELLWTQKIAQW